AQRPPGVDTRGFRAAPGNGPAPRLGSLRTCTESSMRLFRAPVRIQGAAMIYEAALPKDFELTEQDELARLRRGDPAALSAAVNRYQHRLYRYLFRLVREPAAADDLFQQTWLNAVRQIRRYDPRRSFDTWLFAIAHNAAMDLLRRRPGESLDEHEFPAAADSLG